MAAALSLRVYTGSAAGTESASVTGVDFISADNATNTLANRQANPITVGTNSYEKWLKLKIDTAPANGVTNFKVWGDGAVMTSTTLDFTGAYITGTTPTTGVSAIANVSFTTYTSGNKATWDATSYSATNATTKYAVFQLQADATAGPGNWTQETISYSYDETVTMPVSVEGDGSGLPSVSVPDGHKLIRFGEIARSALRYSTET